MHAVGGGQRLGQKVLGGSLAYRAGDSQHRPVLLEAVVLGQTQKERAGIVVCGANEAAVFLGSFGALSL